MRMNGYFPSLPAMTSALIETRRQFSSASQRDYHHIDIYKSGVLNFPSAEEREIAERFDVSKELQKAIQARAEAGLTNK